MNSKRLANTEPHLEAVVESRRAKMELSVITVRHPSCMHGIVHCASVLIFSSTYICQHDLQNLWLHRRL